MNIAFLFPGQGSQSPGMGREICEKYDESQEAYKIASRVSQLDIEQLSFSGTAHQLKETQNAQLTIFTMSMAIFYYLTTAGIKPSVVAGHSLGEFSSFVASRCISFEDGIMLVKNRGMIMSEAARKSNGAMLAILGIPSDEITKWCQAEEHNSSVCVANYNTPSQIVISGTKNAVHAIGQLAKKEGAKIIPLPLNGAFHSPLMKKADDEFSKVISNIKINNPVYPVIGNVNASVLLNASEIKDEMFNQMLSPVRWNDSINKMLNMEVERFVEIGPGKVLKGLLLRINRKAEVYSTGSVREIEFVKERLLAG